MNTGTTVLWKYNMFSLNFSIILLISMPDQFNLHVIRSKSAFLWYILIVHLTYTIDCVAAQKLPVFMQSRPVLDPQENVLHRNKCGNLMLTLRSCISNKFLICWDNYLNFTPNSFKLNFLSDDITEVLHFYTRQSGYIIKFKNICDKCCINEHTGWISLSTKCIESKSIWIWVKLY